MDEIIVYTIAEAAERLSQTHQQPVTHRTLHYYESKFNLPINRDGAGNRIYTEHDLDLFDKIIDLKKKGMTLDGIKTLFEEKGILEHTESTNVIVLDEKAMEAKDIILNEIRSSIAKQIREEFKETHEKMDQISEKLDQALNDNEALRETIRTMQRQSEDHYKKVDQQLTAWRNNRPWYQKLFGKKEDDNE